MTIDAVLDIETLGVGHNAVVASVGIAMLDRVNLALGLGLHVVLPIKPQMAWKRSVDCDTLQWWANQNKELYTQLFQSSDPYVANVLNQINTFLADNGFTSESMIWGNPASFDCDILRSLYEDCSYACQWSWRQQMCLRTLRKLWPSSTPLPDQDPATKHHALRDAEFQATTLVIILGHLRL